MQSFIASPFNYTGGKYRLLSQILPHFPSDIDAFYDIFCGGCNVGINVRAKKTIYNDSNSNLISLLKIMRKADKKDIFEKIFGTIREYGLTDSATFGYSHYGCDSSKGLGNVNKAGFLRLREDFNNDKNLDFNHYIKLFVLIVFAFNNQIRFNKFGNFNLPVGKRDFNAKMRQKLDCFLDVIQSQNAYFSNLDFGNIANIKKNDFVYADPPYLITCACYNENGGWSEFDEVRLLDFLDNLDKNGVKFALSNVLANKNKTNEILAKWLENRNYRVSNLNADYANANYQSKDRNATTDEILVTNY